MNRLSLGLALPLILVAIMACATEPYPMLEAGEPLIVSGALLFTGADGNLYTAQDSEIRLVAGDASDSYRYTGYAWAGESIVFAAQYRDSSGDLIGAIGVADGGRRPRTLFSQSGFAPFFLNPTASGSRVGYLGSQSGIAGFVMGSVDIESGDRVLHGQGQPFYATWSPDGESLMTHIGAPGSSAGSGLGLQTISELTVQTDAEIAALSEIREAGVGLPLGTGVFQAPEYSPDGEQIAVILGDGETSGIHLLGSDGTDRGRLVELEGIAGSLAWSPIGTRIAYTDGFPSSIGALVGRLYIARVGAARPRLISERAIAHFWSPDGAKLLYFEPLVTPGSNAIGYRVVVHYLADDQSRVLATMRPSRAFASQIIPFVDQYERSYTLWSPDSRLIALNSLAINGQDVVHVVDTESFAPTNTFRVGYSLVQNRNTTTLGILPAEGVVHRAIAAGSIPFFSPGTDF